MSDEEVDKEAEKLSAAVGRSVALFMLVLVFVGPFASCSVTMGYNVAQTFSRALGIID